MQLEKYKGDAGLVRGRGCWVGASVSVSVALSDLVDRCCVPKYPTRGGSDVQKRFRFCGVNRPLNEDVTDALFSYPMSYKLPFKNSLLVSI